MALKNEELIVAFLSLDEAGLLAKAGEVYLAASGAHFAKPPKSAYLSKVGAAWWNEFKETQVSLAVQADKELKHLIHEKGALATISTVSTVAFLFGVDIPDVDERLLIIAAVMMLKYAAQPFFPPE